MAKKTSTSKLSTMAAKVMSAKTKPPLATSKSLAASVLAQDEKRGQKK